MPKTLAELEHALRCAVEARQYVSVQELATAFCHAGAEQMAALRPKDPERAKIARRITEVLDWALLMMLTARASCLDELNRVLIANRYLHKPDVSQERVHLNL